jgi:hypothetical protein
MRHIHARLLAYGVAVITDTRPITTRSRVEVRAAPRVRATWDDAYIRAQLEEIETALPMERRYNALDRLYFAVTNHHPHGWAADVLETIARAMDKY